MRNFIMTDQDSRQKSSCWGWRTWIHDIGVRDVKRGKVMAFRGMDSIIGFMLPT